MTEVSGTIVHVFAHRFVVDTEAGAILADITPKELERVSLRIGDAVTLNGEMKPSELKVSRLSSAGKTYEIDHHKHGDKHHHAPADPRIVLTAARDAGFEPIGEPRRKPKHFEVLGRRNGDYVELHIELDGHIRKTKPAARNDHKWSDAGGKS